MSRESVYHVRLVELAASEIRKRHGHLYSLSIFVDLPSSRSDRPPMIGGFVPDIFAVDAPETCRVIGEAKTPLDCETPRSRSQIVAFLSHLSKFPNSAFYLAVPMFYRPRARIIIETHVEAAEATSVAVNVI